MKQQVIIDTGPLVAFINRREHFHAWVINTLATIGQPLLRDLQENKIPIKLE
ncbi:MAG: hypothetical protein V7L21_16665 [Nostoc sp.]|uniref:hypothetical protein n=1 Tax=Nostoc sp. TaxID=1180 RepID=UPI002FFAB5B0